MTNKDQDIINYVKIGIKDVQDNAYSNFMESIRSPETRRAYDRNLKIFLELISDEMFSQYLGHSPKSRNIADLSNAFVYLAKKDSNITKSIVKSYLKQIKQQVDSGKMNSNTITNKIKPIKKLLRANEIDISWGTINQMLPIPTQSEDHAYKREDIQKMIKQCSSLTDKLIILMFSSGGFRLDAWNYFCWKDVQLIKDKEENINGASLCVYRREPEQYWTFITPEACHILELYREEWKSRFLRYPKDDDPLLVSARYDMPTRLKSTGVKFRVNKIVTKIGLRNPENKKDRRYDVKLDHGFRKYFNTMLRRAKVDYLDKEDMMGHKVGLESHYERYEDNSERFPEYQKAIAFLTISDEERLRVEAHEKQDEIIKLEQKNTEIQELKEQMDEIKNGVIARTSHYEKLILKAEDPTVRMMASFFGGIVEESFTEEQKRRFWHQQSEEKLDKQQMIEMFSKPEIRILFDGLNELARADAKECNHEIFNAFAEKAGISLRR